MDFQGEDGKAIDHHAGRFRVEGAIRLGRVERLDQPGIHFLDKIISLLVEGVDGSLGPVNILESPVIPPGFVLGLPEAKIAQVVFLYPTDQTPGFGSVIPIILPLDETLVVESGYFLG